MIVGDEKKWCISEQRVDEWSQTNRIKLLTRNDCVPGET